MGIHVGSVKLPMPHTQTILSKCVNHVARITDVQNG
nr:MAG TPA: hypothetical protein [Caudoviricetes sp.]